MSITYQNPEVDPNGASEVNLRTATGVELLGQQTSAVSLPVVIASNQSAVPVSGTFWQATQPVSAASLPLPTGAATSALQTTGNASLASIDAGIPAALGQTTMAASMSVVIASNQTAIPVTGTFTSGTPDKTAFTYGTTAEQPIGGVYQDTAPSLSAGTSGAIRSTANRALHTNLRDSSGNELLGQKVMASSVPTVVASDQAPIPTQTWGPNSHYTRVSTNGTTVIKSGAGFLRRVIKQSGGNVILYDNTAGSGTVIQAITGTNPTGTLVYDIPFTTGLTVVSTNGPDAIFVWD